VITLKHALFYTTIEMCGKKCAQMTKKPSGGRKKLIKLVLGGLFPLWQTQKTCLKQGSNRGQMFVS
jgi:hypothetical protein